MAWRRHRQPDYRDDELQSFEVRYRHDGRGWTLTLLARDADDARARLANLTDARLAIDEDARGFHPIAAVAHFVRDGLSRIFTVNF